MADGGLSRRAFLKGAAVGVLGGIATVGFGRQVADELEVERVVLRLPGWPLPDYSVALLADFHAIDEARVRRAISALRLAAESRPDLLVIAGDFTSRATPWALELLRRSLEGLPRGVPCVGVMGNHDYASGDPRAVAETVAAAGVLLLRNEVAEIGPVAVAGVDDMLYGRGDWACAAAYSGSRPLLAVVHEPDAVVGAPTNVALQLSGHSHGGQICLPFGHPLRLPPGARRFWRGFHPEATRPLYVTRGVGTTGLDLRLWCPPEVSILTLVAE
ncbi:MAG: metallophosphoesterase [Fimbriimonadaceae bacterium]